MNPVMNHLMTIFPVSRWPSFSRFCWN